MIARLTEHLKDLDILVDEFEAKIKAWHRSSELSMKLEKIPGIGPLGASALVASIADANSFANGRQLSAWLGLVPRQHSSGGKPALLGISKRGDVYRFEFTGLVRQLARARVAEWRGQAPSRF